MIINRRKLINALFVLTLALIPCGLLLGGEQKHAVELPFSSLGFDTGTYTMISFQGGRYMAQPGEPWLPFMVKSYVLPQGTRISGVKLEVLKSRTIYIDKPVYPAQPLRPLSSTKSIGFAAPAEEIYSMNEPYSEFAAEVLNEGVLEGQRIATVALYPLRYTPGSGKLEIAEKMTLSIQYERDPSWVPTTIPSRSIQQSLNSRLAAIVENPQAGVLNSNYTALGNEYRHVIVTTSALKANFQPLADWNTKRGVRDTVVTLESIVSSYSGKDPAEKIRNFVKYAHSNWGLEYLILGGDASIIPTRDCFTTASDGNHYDTIPTDMYFGCLDGDWDKNRNGTYGEVSDDADLYAEVAVGRISVVNGVEAGNFVAKLISYENAPPSNYSNKLMLPSEVLWEEPYYPGDATNNAIAALAPAGTQIQKLYETTGNINNAMLRDSLNAGVGLAHHMAHGNIWIIATGPDAFTSVMAHDLVNADRVAVYNAISCLVGAFDFTNCIVEEFQNAPAGGTVAWIGNSRYGWGMPPMQGPSEDLDVSFFQSVYGKSNPEAGLSLVDSKDANAESWGSSAIGLWCIYELNLFGDPSMPVHYRQPSDFTVAYPGQIIEGQQTLPVSLSSQAGYPVEGMLVCARQGTSVYSWAKTDASGTAYLDINPSIGTISITASGANHRFFSKDGIPVGSRQPLLVLSPDTLWMDVDANGLSEYFTIANEGSDTLKISSILPNNTSWIKSVTPANCSVAPGGYQGIQVTVDTTGVKDSIYLGSVRILSNDQARPTAYEPVKLIKGDWPDIDIVPEPLVFDMPANNDTISSAAVFNKGRADLQVTSISTTDSWIVDIQPNTFSIPSGDFATVYVIVDTSGLGFGTYNGKITFQTNDPDEQTRSLAVKLNMGEPDIAVEPDTLQFYVSYEDPSKNITSANSDVQNKGTRTLSVSNIVPSRSWILVGDPKSFEIQPFYSKYVEVSVNPEGLKQGVYDASITISSNDPDEPSKKQQVRLLLEEAPPKIVCSPDTALMDNKTMRGTFWVFNEGMRDLVVSNISSPTPWIYGLFPKGFTVRGQDSAQVTMVGDASKVSQGPKIGTVEIESNDTKKPLTKVPVKLGPASGIAEGMPLTFELVPVAPNPVSSRCMVTYAVPRQSQVSLGVYDVAGKRVRLLEQGLVKPGYYTIIWNGEDDAGRMLPQGVYLLRMESPTYKATQRLVLLR